MQIQPESMQGHFFSIALPIIAAFIVKEASSWLRERRRDKRGSQEMEVVLKNFRLHAHTENGGPLHAENIWYPKNGG